MMMEYSNNQRLALLHLSLISGVGPGLIQKICSQGLLDNPDRLYTLTPEEIMTRIACSVQQAMSIVKGLQNTELLHEELTLMERNTITWLTFDNPSYPTLLRYIHLPPTVLFVQGTLPSTSQTLAFVGAREATPYGINVVERFVPHCVQNNWTIVSGGARGIDSSAHTATLKAGGSTIAVLGSGLLKPYPASNIPLFENIITHGGALVSSFSARTQALAGNFPARNRIISGLSKGCLVIQAAEKSGALITAQFALDQGREVMAIPGQIFDQASMGCNKLIQQGAQCITSPEDIDTLFGLTKVIANDTLTYAQTPLFAQTIHQEPLSQKELILKACQKAQSIDALGALTSLTLVELNALLFDLQLEGCIEQTFAGLWQSF